MVSETFVWGEGHQVDLDSRNQILTINVFHHALQTDAENAKEQVLPYGTSTRPKDGVTVSSENKKPQKPKRKKKIRAKVASEQSPNPEEPGAPVAKPKSRSRNHPSNKSEPRAKESIGGEDQRKKRHSGTAKPTIHSTRRDKGKVPGQKLESKPQSGHQYPRQTGS